MITLMDVARAAGVSRSAVSKALLGGGGQTTKVSYEKILHIRKVAQQLGYRPNLIAQRLASPRQNIIGLIVDSQCCNLYRDVLSSIEHLTSESGFRIQVGLVHDNFEVIRRYVDDFLGYDIQNIICLAHYYDFAEKVPPLFRAFRNPVFISKPMTDEPFSFVSPDYYATFYDGVSRLLAMGHRRIIFVKTVYCTYDAEIRAKAFRDAHRDAGVPMTEDQIYRKPVYELDSNDLMTRFLDDVLPMHPDAFILGSKNGVTLCIRHLAERGIAVPKDLSLMAMENWHSSSSLIPSIAVMDNNADAIAEETFKLIIGNIGKDHPETRQIFVKGHIIPGESCIQR